MQLFFSMIQNSISYSIAKQFLVYLLQTAHGVHSLQWKLIADIHKNGTSFNACLCDTNSSFLCVRCVLPYIVLMAVTFVLLWR